MAKCTKNQKSVRGFTLIELMVVIAIVGILTMVGVPQYVVYSKRAKFTEVISTAAQIKKAVEICLLTENSSANCDSDEKIGIDSSVLVDRNEHISSVLISEISMGTIGVEVTGSVALNLTQFNLRATYIPTTSEVAWFLDPASSCLLPEYRYCTDI